MLNFAEQTGSGAVIVVWSFLVANVHHRPLRCTSMPPTDCPKPNLTQAAGLSPLPNHKLKLSSLGGRSIAAPAQF
jgi:hypothetical protein